MESPAHAFELSAGQTIVRKSNGRKNVFAASVKENVPQRKKRPKNHFYATGNCDKTNIPQCKYTPIENERHIWDEDSLTEDFAWEFADGRKPAE